jgi:hypothetical protein
MANGDVKLNQTKPNQSTISTLEYAYNSIYQTVASSCFIRQIGDNLDYNLFILMGADRLQKCVETMTIYDIVHRPDTVI